MKANFIILTSIVFILSCSSKKDCSKHENNYERGLYLGWKNIISSTSETEILKGFEEQKKLLKESHPYYFLSNASMTFEVDMTDRNKVEVYHAFHDGQKAAENHITYLIKQSKTKQELLNSLNRLKNRLKKEDNRTSMSTEFVPNR